MKPKSLSERISEMIPRYEHMFNTRGQVTPTDPLQFHLYHLSLYWFRLIGFCEQTQQFQWIEGDLGACIGVGTEFADQLVTSASPLYYPWRRYLEETQMMLFKRPVTIEQIQNVSRCFDEVLKAAGYDPFGRLGKCSS